MARVKPDATAYWNRLAKYDLLIDGAWGDRSQDKQNLEAGRALWAVLEPFTEGYYVNTEPSADEKRLRLTYGDNYPAPGAAEEQIRSEEPLQAEREHQADRLLVASRLVSAGSCRARPQHTCRRAPSGRGGATAAMNCGLAHSSAPSTVPIIDSQSLILRGPLARAVESAMHCNMIGTTALTNPALDIVSLPACVLDAQGYVVFVNRAWRACSALHELAGEGAELAASCEHSGTLDGAPALGVAIRQLLSSRGTASRST